MVDNLNSFGTTKNMKCLTFTSFILLFSLFQELYPMKLYGDYYIENEGYVPAALNAEPIGYKAGLTRTQYNKLIVGKYYFSRKVGPIGLHIALKRESDGTRINEVKIKSVCKMDYPLQPFTEKFSGIIDYDCCIEAGNYTLTNWSLEEHMRPRIKSFWYGKFIANLRFTEGNKTILEQDLILVFKDRDLKKFEEKHVNVANPKEGDKKRKKNKNKGKSDNGSPENPEIGDSMKFGDNMNPQIPDVGGTNTKLENVNPKVPKPGEDMNPKFGKDTAPEFSKSDMAPEAPIPDMTSQLPKPEMSSKIPKNRKRRPRRIN